MCKAPAAVPNTACKEEAQDSLLFNEIDFLLLKELFRLFPPKNYPQDHLPLKLKTSSVEVSCKQSILQRREGFVQILVKEIISVHFSFRDIQAAFIIL